MCTTATAVSSTSARVRAEVDETAVAVVHIEGRVDLGVAALAFAAARDIEAGAGGQMNGGGGAAQLLGTRHNRAEPLDGNAVRRQRQLSGRRESRFGVERVASELALDRKLGTPDLRVTNRELPGGHLPEIGRASCRERV